MPSCFSTPRLTERGLSLSMRSIALVASVVLVACTGDDDRVETAKLNELTGATKTTALTLTQGTNMSASPSPDGTRVAFALQSALYVMPISGGAAKRLSAWDMEVTQPAWSPDGTTIAFQNYDSDGQWHIWAMNPDGTNTRKLTTGPFETGR